ncbi:FAD binding domain-containing protein, partial [Jimgerdemannia flammicorona]
MTFDEFRELIDHRVAPEKLILTNPKWITSFRINERLANGYRRGKAFIAGDAAHCHSPAGGQGLNMGLQDAHNLGWKIAFAVQGKVKDADLLLESYNTERIPIARSVLSYTTSMTRGVYNQGFFASFVRRYIFPLIAKSSRVYSKTRNNMLGIMIAYPSSPLNHLTPSILRQIRQRKSWLGFLFGSRQHLIEPGKHMPDGMLKLPRIQPGRDTLMLYDVVRGTITHTLLLFASGHGITRDKNPLVGKVLEIAGRYKSTITATVIGFKNVIDYQDFNNAEGFVEKTFAEQVPALHESFGVSNNSQAVVVVRPDLYVAFSATEEEVESG